MMRQCFISSSRQTQEAAASSTVLLSQEQIHSPVVESKNLTALELAQLDLLPTVQRLRTADFRLFMQTIDRIFSPLSFVLAGRMRKAGRVLIAGIAPCPINVLTSADHIQLNHPNQRNSLMCPNEPYHPSTIRTCLTQHSPSCFSRSMDTAANRRFSFDERIETDDSDSYNWTTEITSFFRTNVGITPDSTVQYNNSAYHFAPHNSRSVSASSLTVIASSSLFSEIHDAWKEYQGWVFKNLKHAANCTHPPGFDVYGQPIVFSIHHSLIFFFSVYHFSPNHEQVPNDPIFPPQLDNQQSYTLLPVQRRSFQLEANLQNGDYQPPNTLPGEDTHAFSPNMIGEQYSYISSRSISQIRTSVRSANTARVLLLCPTVPIWSVSANASAPPTGTSDHRSRAHCSGWDPELLSQQSSIKLHLQMPNIPKVAHNARESSTKARHPTWIPFSRPILRAPILQLHPGQIQPLSRP
ncbi:hypothetical protein BLNAU_24995 [Blattamonas nauphoetae]|uniref:Uncharacterized protein n=1 Tax=Blattamonas nauphoetae TaxID=2049346 RepID=A0ABQ9WKV3_9EUKA|nr:hypothetical protein BLNAU_24995 [Blattamonas nauphoetae]